MTPSEIIRPYRRVRVDISAYLDMPADRYTGGSKQRDKPRPAACLFHLSKEHPMVPATFARYGSKVPIGDPAFTFVGMSPVRATAIES